MKTTTIRLFLGTLVIGVICAISIPSIVSCNSGCETKDTNTKPIDSNLIPVDTTLTPVDSAKVDSVKK